MTTLNISINTDNAAFADENLGSEISRILKSYANAIESVIDPDTSWELETRLRRLDMEAYDREVDLGAGDPNETELDRVMRESKATLDWDFSKGIDELKELYPSPLEGYDPFVSSEDYRMGQADIDSSFYTGEVSFPSTVVHELIHRAFDTRAVRDFFDRKRHTYFLPRFFLSLRASCFVASNARRAPLGA